MTLVLYLGIYRCKMIRLFYRYKTVRLFYSLHEDYTVKYSNLIWAVMAPYITKCFCRLKDDKCDVLIGYVSVWRLGTLKVNNIIIIQVISWYIIFLKSIWKSTEMGSVLKACQFSSLACLIVQCMQQKTFEKQTETSTRCERQTSLRHERWKNFENSQHCNISWLWIKYIFHLILTFHFIHFIFFINPTENANTLSLWKIHFSTYGI